MICPICETDCKDAPVCPNCEWVLSEGTADIGIGDPPVGRYEGIDGYLDVGYYTITIHKQIHERTVERVMAFEEITNAAFREATEIENGFFGVRTESDLLPLVTTELDAVCDETTLVFTSHKNSVFRSLYDYLKVFNTAYPERMHTKHSDGKLCPRCKSKRIMNRYMYVPIFVAIENSYVCRSCGFQWDA